MSAELTAAAEALLSRPGEPRKTWAELGRLDMAAQAGKTIINALGQPQPVPEYPPEPGRRNCQGSGL